METNEYDITRTDFDGNTHYEIVEEVEGDSATVEVSSMTGNTHRYERDSDWTMGEVLDQYEEDESMLENQKRQNRERFHNEDLDDLF
jgi:hypothetical protein